MEQKYGIIYRAYDSEGKSYVGQTVKSLEARRKAHWYKRKDNHVFHNALLKKGLDAFTWEILEENIPEDKLLERERYWAEYFDVCENGYNGKSIFCFPRGITPNKGKHHTSETKRKMSAAHKGNTATKGKHWKLSEEVKQKMSAAHKGSHLSAETKQKLSEAAKGNTAGKGKTATKGKHWKLVDGKRIYY